MYKAENVCSTPEMLIKGMDYLQGGLHKKHLSRLDDQRIQNETSILNPDTALEVKKNVFISVPYVPGLSEKFRRIFQQMSVQVICKGAKTFKIYPYAC